MTRPLRTALACAATLAVAGCGGGSSSPTGSDVDTACLQRAGFTADDAAATVVLDGAEPVFADGDAGVTIYRAGTAADAKRIADASRASEAKGSAGRLLWLAPTSAADRVRACL